MNTAALPDPSGFWVRRGGLRYDGVSAAWLSPTQLEVTASISGTADAGANVCSWDGGPPPIESAGGATAAAIVDLPWVLP